MFCPNCAGDLDDGLTQCTFCGFNLVEEQQPYTDSQPYEAQVVYAEPSRYDNQQPQYNYQQPQSNYQQAQNNYYQPQYQRPAATDPGKGMGIASMVLGITSYFVPIPLILPIIGAILGFMSKSNSEKAGFKNTFAIAGLVLSLVNLGMYVLSFIASIVLLIIYIAIILFTVGVAGMGTYMYF